MYEHGHVQQQKGGKKEEATSCRGRSELHSGSHQFLWLSGTLCYDLFWPIGPEQEVRTGDREPFSHRPSSHAARRCEFYWPEPRRSHRARHALRDDNSTVAGFIFLFTSPLEKKTLADKRRSRGMRELNRLMRSVFTVVEVAHCTAFPRRHRCCMIVPAERTCSCEFAKIQM